MSETPELNNAQVTELSTDELDLVTGGANTNKPKNSAPLSSGFINPVDIIASGNGLVHEGTAIEKIAVAGLFGDAQGVAVGLGLQA